MEEVRVEFDDGVETWSSEIVRVDTEEVFGGELDACDCSGCESFLQLGYGYFDDALGWFQLGLDKMAAFCCLPWA